MSTPDPPPTAPTSIPENLSGFNPDLSASPESLIKILRERPVLWVGAGASIAAGYPGTNRLIQAMVETADDPLDPELPFFEVADRFVGSTSDGTLQRLLQREIGPPRSLTPLHRAIARLAAADYFAAIVTTNYDDLLERSLADAKVPYDHKLLSGDGEIPLLKLHGSRHEWEKVVLSGESYRKFRDRYPYLYHEMDLLLRRHPVLFLGCSMKDPRILDWLAALSPEAEKNLSRWRILLTQSEWDEALRYSAKNYSLPVLWRNNIRPLLLQSHKQVEAIFTELTSILAPRINPERFELTIEIQPDGHCTASMADLRWIPLNIWQDKEWQRLVNNIDLGISISFSSASREGVLRADAALVGEKLTNAFLSLEAQRRLSDAAYAARGGTPCLLVVRVLPARRRKEDEALADQILALPWELLWIDDCFPIEEALLDLVRDSKAARPEHQEEVIPRYLTSVAIAAVPTDKADFDYEEEVHQLWSVLNERSDQQCLFEADVGTLGELARSTEAHKPFSVHFIGYAGLGTLFFEDDSAHAVEIKIELLVQKLRAQQPLPQLLYLSLLPSPSEPEAPTKGTEERQFQLERATLATTAASLHRAGFPQVVAYFGQRRDGLAARVASSFYSSLANTGSVAAAVRKARQTSKTAPGSGRYSADYYPLGWANLVLFESNHVAYHLLSERKSAGCTQKNRYFHFLSKYGSVSRLHTGFVGRRKLLSDAIKRWAEGERFTVVTGIGGLGKSALCSRLAPRLAKELAPEADIVAFDCHYASRQADPLSLFIKELQAKKLIKSRRRGADSVKILSEALLRFKGARSGILIYLDGLEHLQQPAKIEREGWLCPEIGSFWEFLVDLAKPGRGVGLLASSRYRPPKTPLKAQLFVPPMAHQEICKLLCWWPTLEKLAQAEKERLAEKIEGHPGTVEGTEQALLEGEPVSFYPGYGHSWPPDLIERVLKQVQRDASSSLGVETIWNSLDERSQEHLGRCTILTRSVPWDAIQALADDSESALQLIRMGMLTPERENGLNFQWTVHRLVKMAVEELWHGDRKHAHKLFGEWLWKGIEAADE